MTRPYLSPLHANTERCKFAIGRRLAGYASTQVIGALLNANREPDPLIGVSLVMWHSALFPVRLYAPYTGIL